MALGCIVMDNQYLQHFIKLEEYQHAAPYHSSMLTNFR
jgi:hypothetical protein